MKVQRLVLLFYFYIKYVVSLDCYWNKECKYKYFGSKTPYEIVRGDIRDSIVKTKGCEAISVWTIMRHGKRNPGINFIQHIKEVLVYKNDIISSYERGNSSLCAQDVQNLKDWEVETALFDEPNKIAVEGYQEIFGIAHRLKNAVPELLGDLKNDMYLFVPAFGERMVKSAEAFIDGLEHRDVDIENNTSDYSTLAPYSNCGTFQTEIFQNPHIFGEVSHYLETTDYLNMKERVEKKLGLNQTLSDKNIISFYDLCRYLWNGIKNKPSPWCAIFSDEDVKVLEYIDDLKHYYRNSYGALRFSSVLGQLPLADMLTKFKEAKDGKGRKVVAYFTHATMMDMILVVLNAYKDTNPLTGERRNVNRRWRSSLLSTFSSNFIAVLNRCTNPRRKEYDYNIAFYWNEQPLLEICKAGVCSWQHFEDKFKLFLNTTTDLCEFKAALIE